MREKGLQKNFAVVLSCLCVSCMAFEADSFARENMMILIRELNLLWLL